MLYRLRRALRMAWFDHNAKPILATKPVACDPRAGFVMFSQVCHSDLLMYLLALKSLTRFIRPGKIIALDDGTLTQRDRDVLAAHVERVQLVHVNDIPNELCPKGNCWERLLAVVDTAKSAYVIQLDADTLTLRYPQELAALVAAGTSFTLGTETGQTICSMAEAADRGKRWVAGGVNSLQVLAEASFDRLPGYECLSYIRGSAGFTGYAAGSVSRTRAEWFSQQMSNVVGRAKWAFWGTDQVASNFLIANAASATVLPLRQIQTLQARHRPRFSRLCSLHWSDRFKRGTYITWSRRVIQDLRTAC